MYLSVLHSYAKKGFIRFITTLSLPYLSAAQAYFYTHPSRRDYAHSAVVKLEKIADEWPALISLVMAGPDGGVVDNTCVAKRIMQ